MRVKKLPMILALHLKRFKYMEQLQRYTKLSYRVVFPLELRLFNTSGDATNPERLYDLVAVVVHCGRLVRQTSVTAPLKCHVADFAYLFYYYTCIKSGIKLAQVKFTLFLQQNCSFLILNIFFLFIKPY